MATGGGSYKFYERMKKVLDVEVTQEDEMECLIVGDPITPARVNIRSRFLHPGDSGGGFHLLTNG